MTARERRQRKALARGGSGAEGADGSAPEPGMGGGKKKKAAGSAVRRSTPCDQPFGRPRHSLPSCPQPVHRRGKKGKLKKLKGKYADQDDDERRLRMELLGHKQRQDEGKKAGEGAAAIALS